MRLHLPLSLLLASAGVHANAISKRAEKECEGIAAPPNNGDRKIAIVVDSSASMSGNDENRLRVMAAQQLNTYLIASDEAVDGKKPDVVTVVDFDDRATVLYALGDPAGAAGAYYAIDESGGTNIAGGIDLAIAQLNGTDHGPTADRSGMLVLTDGSDSSALRLVDVINNATDQGIRVSFGFLTRSIAADRQDTRVLGAIFRSGGQYATVSDPAALQRFVNLVTANGLTKQDPSTLLKDKLIAGLSIAGRVSGDGEDTKVYGASRGETLRFSIRSVDAGTLEARLIAPDGKLLSETTVRGTTARTLDTVAQLKGNYRVTVKATNAPQDAMYLVGVTSDAALGNCTFNDGEDSGSGGLSTGSKVGIGIGVPLAVGALAAGTFLLWKGYQAIQAGAAKAAQAGLAGEKALDAATYHGDVAQYAADAPTNHAPINYAPADGGLGQQPLALSGAEQALGQPPALTGAEQSLAQPPAAVTGAEQSLGQTPLTTDPTTATQAAQNAADGLHATQGAETAKVIDPSAAQAAHGAVDGAHAAQTSGLEAAKVIDPSHAAHGALDGLQTAQPQGLEAGKLASGAADGAHAALGADPATAAAKAGAGVQGAVEGAQATAAATAAQSAAGGAHAGTAAGPGVAQAVAAGSEQLSHPAVTAAPALLPPSSEEKGGSRAGI